MSQCELYSVLRKLLPSFPYEGRLSKLETLRLSISYILLLRDLLESPLMQEQGPREYVLERGHRGTLWATSDLISRVHWIDWQRLGLEEHQQYSQFHQHCQHQNHESYHQQYQ